MPDLAIEYNIYAALHEESNAPWVWLSTPDLPSRTIVRIRSEKPKRTIYCECRKIDANFIRYYNRDEQRRNITESSIVLVISTWYRNKLEIPGTGMRVLLRVVPYDNWWGELGLYRKHPDRIVRLAVSLGILSVVLGIVGGFLGALSFAANFLNN